MDKTEQENDVGGAATVEVKQDVNSLKDQSKNLEENIGISLGKDQDVTENESKKPTAVLPSDISCNGVKEGETIVNGDTEKTNEEIRNSEPEKETEDILNESEKVVNPEDIVTEKNGEVKNEEKDVVLNGPSEKDETESTVVENSVKEPDKIENTTESTSLEQNSEVCPIEEEKIPSVPVELSDLGSDSLTQENTNTSDTVTDSAVQEETDVEMKTIENENATFVNSPDVSEKQPEELTKISGELIEHSSSSGPPSLVKEVNSDDNSVLSNSVTSEHIGNEESMEIDEKHLNEEIQSEQPSAIESKDLKVIATEAEKPVEKDPVKDSSCDLKEKIVEEPKKEIVVRSAATSIIQSKTMSKGQKLDQLLSKITTKAETDSQKVVPPPQKHAKARKSCVSSASNSVSKPSIPASITSLTFNVKELEKKGVLDMPKPKPSKRKAFEPIKIPSPDKSSSPPKKGSPVRSPLKSPVKSPGKTENPFFIKQKLIRRKKKRKAYKLPGEKVWKKTKSKKSEERQLSKDSEKETNNDKNKEKDVEKTVASESSEQQVSQMGASMPVNSTPNKVPNLTSSDKAADSKSSPTQRNALDMLTMNSRKSFSSASSSGSLKKARKTVRQGIDPATHRTLDSFLKSGSHSRKMQDTVPEKNVSTERSMETSNGEQRKRKAVDQIKSGLITSPKSPADSCLASPEEKKRKMEASQSPPQQQHVITLLPTGSPPLSMPTAGHPIIPASGTGSQIFLSPGTSSGSQTIIQNGTLNGLPMFQIFNNQSIASSQTAQFVAIAQSQGRQVVTTSSQPGSTALLQPKGVPLLFTPMPLSTVVTNNAGSQSQVLFSKPGVLDSVTSSMFGKPAQTVLQSAVQQQHSVLKNTLTQPRMQLPNGQYIDLKLPKDFPNGMYPVTPPRTPEEQRSETGSQDTGEEMEAVLGSVTPEKDVIPLCTCKISGASFQKMTTIVTFCQALDSVDGKVLGCCNKVTNPQLVRPAVKIPFLALCDSHRKRLRVHQCCPGCGHFCTQGKFLQCKKEGSSFIHNFHEQCQVTKDGKNFCPHCGETSNQYEVHLSMQETKPAVAKESKPSNRSQVKARIGVVDRKSTSSGEETADEPVVSHTLDKSKKVLSTADVPLGPDRYSLERVLSSLTHERPKKYRHLPKCLYTPAYDNDLERVVYMLEDGHDPNELYDDLDGQSALHAAAAIGSLSIVHVLIQSGASPHHQDKSLKTPLMFAAEENHPDVVSYLIKANAIIDAKADDGMTALHFAAKAGNVNIINMLLNSDRLDINTTDDGGWTPLIWAAEHTQVDAVKLLLKRKADPNLRDSEENTTMHWAAFSGSVAIAELLLSAGCDLDSLNMHGDRPLHIAARQNHYECVVLFLARGADVEAKNNKGETPLECCIEQNTAVYLALKVNKQLKSFGAKHMGKPDKLIHRDLSKGRENIPIPCVNGVDDEGEPKDYLYVVDNIETTCLNINRVIGSLQTCQCKDDCSSIYCACGKNSIRCWYDKYNRLIPEFNMLEPPLIFECNRACECWTTCNNRVVQNGVMSRLQVFKTVGRGWGCKTLVDIARGTFICEYIGEHISDCEADRREDDSYLFDLDNKDGETYCIDARRYGNVARFINHLCEPNLTPVKVFVDSQDLRFPRICLFANRDIKAQEELGFDYGEKFWIIKWKQFTCTCGSPKCRYSSDTIQKTLEEYRQRHEIDGEEIQD
ncbi:uncharacterized protein LOC123550294 isoform X2 [Mercenaria mercenaria]|uniref:uncharacterized protein LOC123550294 isoform X2 n=1 Tax=Mercenaria mercenaria TaxID=6596 RepID=UPI00234EE26F|nr:uncharacterized protein LOC123550294 isoform X2 [Mercenaria mercenaria]